MLQSGISELAQAPFWAAVPQIVLVDILLSGDNAVIIAMACRELPRSQRRWGIALGASVGVILRLLFAVAITWLLELPYLKLAGGVALLYIGARLILPQESDRSQVEAAVALWRVVWIVAVADIVMSFDNILALVQIAKGDIILLAIGLVISIPLVVFGAALVASLLERLPLLIWAGAALLGWVAGRTISDDAEVANWIADVAGPKSAPHIHMAIAGGGAVFVVVAGGLWRHWRTSSRRGTAADEQK